ncbi:hypothetical protein G5V59_24380 [Nocardioides sp. W3-2-3]|nr:hypothetical protein [Nocardioides convexus]
MDPGRRQLRHGTGLGNAGRPGAVPPSLGLHRHRPSQHPDHHHPGGRDHRYLHLPGHGRGPPQLRHQHRPHRRRVDLDAGVPARRRRQHHRSPRPDRCGPGTAVGRRGQPHQVSPTPAATPLTPTTSTAACC